MNDNTADSADGLFRLLFVGDVVGEPGRKAVAVLLPLLKEELKLDFIVVNGENSAGGRGITPKIAISLMRAGAAVVTVIARNPGVPLSCANESAPSSFTKIGTIAPLGVLPWRKIFMA